MATKVALPNPAEYLVHLIEVSNQVKVSKDVDKDTAAKGRSLAATAGYLEGDWGAKLVELGAVEADVKNMADDLRTFATLFAPQANELWDETEVSVQLNYLEAIVPLGLLNDDEVAALNEVKQVLASARKGNGTRAERTPQERIEGRPNFITSTYVDAEGATQRIGTNAANVSNSASNIKTAAVRFINDALKGSGQSATQEQVTELTAAIKTAIEKGTVTSALGITFTPVEARPE